MVFHGEERYWPAQCKCSNFWNSLICKSNCCETTALTLLRGFHAQQNVILSPKLIAWAQSGDLNVGYWTRILRVKTVPSRICYEVGEQCRALCRGCGAAPLGRGENAWKGLLEDFSAPLNPSLVAGPWSLHGYAGAEPKLQESLLGGQEGTHIFQSFLLQWPFLLQLIELWRMAKIFCSAMFLEICEPAPFQHTPGSCAGYSLATGGSSRCWIIAQLHSESFEIMQNRDEFQMVVKILCYCYKSLGVFSLLLSFGWTPSKFDRSMGYFWYMASGLVVQKPHTEACFQKKRK